MRECHRITGMLAHARTVCTRPAEGRLDTYIQRSSSMELNSQAKTLQRSLLERFDSLEREVKTLKEENAHWRASASATEAETSARCTAGDDEAGSKAPEGHRHHAQTPQSRGRGGIEVITGTISAASRSPSSLEAEVEGENH